MKVNILDMFMDKLLAFPLWVKQIIYLRLYQNLLSYLSEDFIVTNVDDIFHLYVPELSFTGKSELAERRSGFDANIYKFMSGVNDGLNLLEICMNNFWTMEEVAKFFVLCSEQNYIKTPKSKYINSMAGFMSGKYRTGEYFRHIDKISVDQLQQVIVKQKQAADEGNPVKMAELMISLGYITEKDCSSLLVLKEEAKKRFILDASLVPKIGEGAQQQSQDGPQTESANEDDYKSQIEKLKEQNRQLIEQQKKVLAFLKKQQQNG